VFVWCVCGVCVWCVCVLFVWCVWCVCGVCVCVCVVCVCVVCVVCVCVVCVYVCVWCVFVLCVCGVCVCVCGVFVCVCVACVCVVCVWCVCVCGVCSYVQKPSGSHVPLTRQISESFAAMKPAEIMFRRPFMYFAAITCLIVLLVYEFQPQFNKSEKNYVEESQVINDGYKFDTILNARR